MISSGISSSKWTRFLFWRFDPFLSLFSAEPREKENTLIVYLAFPREDFTYLSTPFLLGACQDSAGTKKASRKLHAGKRDYFFVLFSEKVKDMVAGILATFFPEKCFFWRKIVDMQKKDKGREKGLILYFSLIVDAHLGTSEVPDDLGRFLRRWQRPRRGRKQKRVKPLFLCGGDSSPLLPLKIFERGRKRPNPLVCCPPRLQNLLGLLLLFSSLRPTIWVLLTSSQICQFSLSPFSPLLAINPPRYRGLTGGLMIFLGSAKVFEFTFPDESIRSIQLALEKMLCSLQ